MPDVLELIKHTESIEKNVASHSHAVISKKFSHPALEINTYFFPENAMLFVDPVKAQGGLKTYIIFSGRCTNIETGQVLESGDVMIMDHLKPILNFKMLEDTLIYVHAWHDATYTGFVENNERLNELLTLIEEKDTYTKGHCNRVFELSQKLAILLNLSSKQLYNLNMAARYHDVGKVFVPEPILNKAGILTHDEFAIMKDHVLHGKELITAHFSEEIYNIIVLHHERLDGSGYPKGLTGADIPIEGRILALCDSYDAMVTDRVYKKGKSQEEALRELRTLAGKKLDADLIHLLEGLLKEGQV